LLQCTTMIFNMCYFLRIKRQRFNIKRLKTGCQWLLPVILATEEVEIRRITVQSQPRADSLQDPLSWKTHHKKRASGVVQVAQHLPSKYKALSSNPSTNKNKNTEGRGQGWDIHAALWELFLPSQKRFQSCVET
jgi:hypothetical protein